MKMCLSVIWLFNLSQTDRSICPGDLWQLCHSHNPQLLGKKVKKSIKTSNLTNFFESQYFLSDPKLSKLKVCWKVNIKWIWYPRLLSILLTPETLNWIPRKAITEYNLKLACDKLRPISFLILINHVLIQLVLMIGSQMNKNYNLGLKKRVHGVHFEINFKLNQHCGALS